MPAYLNAFGSYLPQRIVSNVELASLIDPAQECSAEWIESVSGIRERRWAEESESVADLAFTAAEDCLKRSGTEANRLALLIVASGSAPPGFPGPAAEVAAR